MYLCCYWSKDSTVRANVEKLRQAGALDYTIVVSASAADPAPLLYIAPYSGVTMGEEFMFNGKHVLIVYDDLTKQAAAYRELSLLLRRPPGREAYPGDVFYLHSRLLERAAKLNDELVAVQSLLYLLLKRKLVIFQLMSQQTLFQLLMDKFSYNQIYSSGVRPAINAGQSVSRVGGSAQIKAMKKVAGTLRLDLTSYRELESFAQFGSDLDEFTAQKLERGKRTVEVLKQDQNHPLPVEYQVLTIYALTKGYLDDIPVEDITRFEDELNHWADANATDLLNEIRETGALPDADKFDSAITEFKKVLVNQNNNSN